MIWSTKAQEEKQAGDNRDSRLCMLNSPHFGALKLAKAMILLTLAY